MDTGRVAFSVAVWLGAGLVYADRRRLPQWGLIAGVAMASLAALNAILLIYQKMAEFSTEDLPEMIDAQLNTLPPSPKTMTHPLMRGRHPETQEPFVVARCEVLNGKALKENSYCGTIAVSNWHVDDPCTMVAVMFYDNPTRALTCQELEHQEIYEIAPYMYEKLMKQLFNLDRDNFRKFLVKKENKFLKIV